MSEALSGQLMRQHSIERALENFKKIGRNNLTPAKIRSRAASLKDLWRAYQDGHVTLTQVIPVPTQATLDYFSKTQFDKTEEVYNATLDYMMDCLEDLEPVVSQHNQSNETVHSIHDASSLSLMHLPSIDMPPFDGNYADWETFRDRFTSLIIQNKDLTDFSRMHFLASALKGRARESIASLAITANNFKIAWRTLSGRYESKRRLLSFHLSALLDLPPVTRESATELQLLCDKVNIAISSLQKLDRTPSELWDDFLVYLTSKKLDSNTRKAWTLHTNQAASPSTFEVLSRFLDSRIRALEECQQNPNSKATTKSASSARVHVATASDSATLTCPLCKSRHFINACPQFTAKNACQRRELVKRFKRCFNCLSTRHSASECPSKYSCRLCDKKHHTTLHIESETSSGPATVTSQTAQASPSVEHADEINSLLTSAKPGMTAQVLLATAWVNLKVASGRSATVRALLDQGSEATFISENVAQLLRAKRIRMPVSISAVGGTRVGTVQHAASVIISPRVSNTPALETTALILPSLTSYAPKRVSEPYCLAHLADLSWADSKPTSSDPIQIIIGADLYGDIIQAGVRKGKTGQPFAQNSIFGWIISGPLETTSVASRYTDYFSANSRNSAHLTVHHCSSLDSLAGEIKRFWEIEEVPRSPSLTPQEDICESHFRATHSRQQDGRYIVRLPFKRDPPIEIGSSRRSAERLYNTLLRRFRLHPELEKEYDKFMREYEQLGHMRRALPPLDSLQQHVHIPHHPVIREDSATTRLRVVFNASCVTSNGSSLNDHLLAGPKLQADLPTILLQWRHFKFVCTADIAKMYRQILVDQRDVDYQRVIWKGEQNEPVEYQLLTVTYGMTCAPFLALRVLQKLIDDDGQRFPLAIPILRGQIYVDDVLFGGDDIEFVRQSRDHLVGLLRSGKFELRKWASNSQELLDDIDPSDHGLACNKQIAADDRVKVLGIVWNPVRDIFQVKVSLLTVIPRSKRSILSTIAKLYDPLGWVTPATISAKIYMQQLWRLHITWDEDIPEPLLSKWISIYSKLSFLNDLQLSRWTGVHSNISYVELHGFADASTLAYAASVYLRVISDYGSVTISLLAGKSKVAPLAPLTVPRLELSAALLLTRLMTFVLKSLAMPSVPCVCWTDSTIVLTWVRAHPSRWKTFVANRVNAIQSQLPDAEWHHVPTSDNPADCASRGLPGDELIRHDLWWQGPSWLRAPREDWPSEPTSQTMDAGIEERIVALHSETSASWDLATRYSSWPRLVRITAYLFRFLKACRRSNVDPPPLSSPNKSLSCLEFRSAKTFWLKCIQAELFSDEISSLSKGNQISPKNKLTALRPFLDRDGVLRVGGRLRQAPLPYTVKHPVLLASHHLVHLIVLQAHSRVLHGGLQLTLSTLRHDFWIIRARSLVKAVIHKCIVCCRERAAIPVQLMGDLPPMRVSVPSRPFSHCGVDYAGPIKVRSATGRGITARKAYIALFICLATRAIHLELVGDYSTPAFLNAYLRFCSRRGLPSDMYSDNGTTFVGAERELRSAYQSAMRDPNFQNKIATDGVSWHFIPPSAPHFGGMWEAGVRSVKHHLRRILGEHTLSFEEFTTLLCKIEACLNSRPVAPLSDSYDDYEILTPGHFLIGSALTVPPEPSLLHLRENRLSRWQLVRHITERFWRVWTSDYLNTLQQRGKWRKVQANIKIGQMILLRNATLPPCKWELGRVTQIHPGPDGLVRVVTVRTATSEYKRPITKLCLLPIENVTPSNDDCTVGSV
ncbi:uncharacterized protein LOC118644157 [Monomorium pharaonis]|uniref:uncharacterized protein LOC118644815 n=1 Tax=Monomorium pharaonis TaxID=307658 RepID=UPI001746EF05|nr:uncharacterized protein LOC118644815 [Monomorium pharaonis]XP_036145733.1 uncharacterized protein LOC118646602 [Monomorium pharaonis]XP_036146138.1 uncharacterized protein LOC118644157 [Monomorium pharaonis]